MIRRLATLLPVLTALGALAAAPVAHASACSDAAAATFATEPKFGHAGLYARPSADPADLVVMMHGYRNDSSSWNAHLLEAADHGVLAFALDYPGIGPTPDLRGWNVQAGADASIEVAGAFLDDCPSITRVTVLGVSMGGNSSGLAVAAHATRADGETPLFDYWIDVEGVTNVIETYLEASAVGPVNAFADGARADIEAEMGGTLAEVPEEYLDHDIVYRTPDIAGSGLAGAIVVHGVDDGLVPYDQGREMATALVAFGIPTDVYTVLRRGQGESGTTITGTVLTNFDPSYQSPLAGHGWEGSDTQLVIRTAIDRLWTLLGGAAPGPYREFIVDGELGTIP